MGYVAIYPEKSPDGPDGPDGPDAGGTDVVFLSPSQPGAMLEVNGNAGAVNQKFRVRVTGQIIRGLIVSEANDKPLPGPLQPHSQPGSGAPPPVPTGVTSNISGDPDCGLPPGTVQDGYFVNCFEFTINQEEEDQQQLVVNILPDSLKLGQNAQFELTVEDVDGTILELPEDQLFQVSIQEGFRDLGTLTSADSVQTGAVLTDVPEGFTFNSAFGTTDTVEVPIKVITSFEDKLLSTTQNVIILGEGLQITLSTPDNMEIWPTITTGTNRGRNVDNNNVLQQAVVLVTEGGLPAEGIGIQLTPKFVLGTGGHDHLNPPPPLNLPGSIAFAGGDSLTGPNGQAGFTYTAPEFSGQVQLTAVATNGGVTALDRDTVLVRVPGLEFLGANSPFYELVGAPQYNDTTNDPCRPEDSFTSQHSFGHHGTPAFNAEIRALAESFFTGNDSTKLRINDISLIHGGVFDTGNDWDPPHEEHRIGRQGDIAINTINKQGECVEDTDAQQVQQEIRNSTFVITETYSTHYHVIFD